MRKGGGSPPFLQVSGGRQRTRSRSVRRGNPRAGGQRRPPLRICRNTCVGRRALTPPRWCGRVSGGGLRAARPTGVTRGAMGGRPQGSPLRITSKSLLRADVGIGPYGEHCMKCGVRRDTWVPPYITLFCRAGPVCPAAGAEKESPSHGFAVPAPFRQGGQGDGGCGLPQPVCALASQ